MKKRTNTILNIVVLVMLVGITVTVLLSNYRELDFIKIKNSPITREESYIAAAFIFTVMSVAFKGLRAIQRRAEDEVYK